MDRSTKIVVIAFVGLALIGQAANAHNNLPSSGTEISWLTSPPSTQRSELADFKSKLPLLTVATTGHVVIPKHTIQPTAQGMVGLGFVALIGVLGLRRKRQG
jgi:hypothetical protein